MKKTFLSIYRCIVGSEYGWTGEGNEQWYYFLGLVMNVMLTWWLKSEIGIAFTIAATVHFVTVCVYGYMALEERSVWCSIAYYAIHLALFIVCVRYDWSWTILTSAIVIFGVLLAPDCVGDNIFMMLYKGNNKKYVMLLCHTIWFAIFVTIALLLPITLWIRLAIIGCCMILHPIIDLSEGECMDISCVTMDSFEKIKDTLKQNK